MWCRARPRDLTQELARVGRVWWQVVEVTEEGEREWALSALFQRHPVMKGELVGPIHGSLDGLLDCVEFE